MSLNEVEFSLHTLHVWSGAELMELQGSIDQIAAQFTCEINYDHRATNMNFTILGADPTTQKKAVIALASLFTKATGAVSDPNIPMKAFEDVKADSGNSGAMSMGGIDRSQLLIDLDDINATMESIALAASITTAAEPPTPERVFTEIFVVSDKIHDPHSMLYADKKQAEDLPTMIAKERKCTAIVPDDGRSITISGTSMAKVSQCIKQLQQMQDYFLRPAFQSELIPLVYGSFRCEYKLKFISATRHRFTTHNIPYFPSNMPELRIRTDLLKVLKTTYDEDRRAWMPNPDEIIAMEELAAQSSRTQSSPRRNPQLYKANSSSTPSLRSWGPSNSQSDWIEPQRSDWGREEPSYGYRTNSRAGSDYEFAMDPRAAEQTRFSQNSNSRGNFSSSSREPSYSGGGRSWTSHQNPNEHSSNSTSTWTSRIQQNQSSNSRPGSRASVGMGQMSTGTTRTMRTSEWSGGEYKRGANDFPSLSSPGGSRPSSVASNRPPPRDDYPPMSSPRGSRPSSVASNRPAPRNDFPSLPSNEPRPGGRSGGMPALPPVRRVDSPYGSGMPMSSDEDYRPQQSGGRWSAPTNNRGMPPTMDDRDLSRSRMRDPDQDREDNRRVYHKLQPQQMDPSTPRGASPAGNEASPVSDPNVDTFIQAVRDFNMKRTKDAIRLGLEELQGHRKEIRLFGRCGSVLFTPRAPVTDRDWEFNQLEEMMRRTGTRGHFSPITTTNTESINNLYSFLGVHVAESAYYEVDCDTRTNPSMRYERTLVTIPSKKAVLERVVTPWKTYTEVTWSAMDRDVDFEVVLQAREGIVHDTKSALGRTDVKPFSNFRKKLSLGPHNSHITCYDIKNFLEVRNIVFKESRFYEKPSDFKIIIHRMKELELERNPVINSVTGYTSSENDDGKVWYEIELYHEKATKMLTANRTLTQGLVAPWEALDLVGANDDSDIVSRMVKALMVIVDEFQKASRLE